MDPRWSISEHLFLWFESAARLRRQKTDIEEYAITLLL